MEGHEEKFVSFCNETFLGTEAAKTSKKVSKAKGTRIVDTLKSEASTREARGVFIDKI